MILDLFWYSQDKIQHYLKQKSKKELGPFYFLHPSGLKLFDIGLQKVGRFIAFYLWSTMSGETYAQYGFWLRENHFDRKQTNSIKSSVCVTSCDCRINISLPIKLCMFKIQDQCPQNDIYGFCNRGIPFPRKVSWTIQALQWIFSFMSHGKVSF